MTRLQRTDVPEQAFRQAMTVRSYEVGQDGRLRAGNVLRYLEWLATEASAAAGFAPAWYVDRDTAWVVRQMDLQVGELPAVGSELEMATWVADFRRVQALRDYAVWRTDTGALVARAHARWAYVDRGRGAPTRLPPEMTAAFAPLGADMRAREQGAPVAGEPRYLDLVAREYEADSQRHINNCVYADWLGEGVLRGATADDPQVAGRLAPRYLHIEYERPALPGAAVRVETRVDVQGGRRLRADQTIVNEVTGQVHVRAWSEYLARRGRARLIGAGPGPGADLR